MPIMYEYSCRDCGCQFEELVFAEDDEVACPKCKSAKTDKLLSACRHKSGGRAPDTDLGQASAPASSGCAGCSGGDCSSCGG